MSDKWHGGKGSKQRPVDKKKFDDNWDKIFGSKQQQQPNVPTDEEKAEHIRQQQDPKNG